MLHFRGGRGAISKEAYPDLEAFYADVAAGYADELNSLGAAGCTYVQLDDTNLAYLCDTHDARRRALARRRSR
jgi:5-methyltetrahydropteroyltriglutamate--homocysteine methyltransferase